MPLIFTRGNSNERRELLAEEVVTDHELQQIVPKKVLVADEINRLKLRLGKQITETRTGDKDPEKHHTQTRIGVERSLSGKHQLLVGREWVGIEGTVSNNQLIELTRHRISAGKSSELVDYLNFKKLRKESE